MQRLIGIVYIDAFPLQVYVSGAAEFWMRQKLRHIDMKMLVEGIMSEHHVFHLHVHLSEIREELQTAVNSGSSSPEHLLNSDS